MESQRNSSWHRLVTPPDSEKRPVGDVGLAVNLVVPDRLVLEMHWEAEPGTVDMESLTVALRLVDGRYEVERLEAAGPPEGYLDLEVVRRYNYRPMLARFLTSQFEYLKRKMRDPDERFGYTYLVAKLTGENPTSAVADELGISVAAAAQRVRRARLQGLLPPAPATRKVR